MPSQYKTGSASVTIHENRIIASADADWSVVNVGYSYFMFDGIAGEVPFLIQTKTPPATSLSHNWEITLAANYDVATRNAAAYLIQLWFTGGLPLALFDSADSLPRPLLNRNFMLIASALSAAGSGGGGSGGAGVVADVSGVSVTGLPRPSYLGEDSAGGIKWWRLEAGAPTSVDKATLDDATSRWHRIG